MKKIQGNSEKRITCKSSNHRNILFGGIKKILLFFVPKVTEDWLLYKM